MKNPFLNHLIDLVILLVFAFIASCLYSFIFSSSVPPFWFVALLVVMYYIFTIVRRMYRLYKFGKLVSLNWVRAIGFMKLHDEDSMVDSDEAQLKALFDRVVYVGEDGDKVYYFGFNDRHHDFEFYYKAYKKYLKQINYE